MRRDAGLDALRATMTLLVLFHHSALTYGALGGWYYHEVMFDGRLETKLLAFFCTVNQACFMGLFFLLAGYFTPGAVARKGAWAYAGDRLVRLGVPLLAYLVLIGPMTIALAQTARGRPFGTTLVRLWVRPVFENGPLWFVQALLVFAGCYLAWRRIGGTPGRVRRFPSDAVLVVAALVTAVAAFALRLVWPVGVTAWGLQLGYFASYVVLFVAGCAGAPGRWLDVVPDRQRRVWLSVAWLALPVLPAMVLLAPRMAVLRGDMSGGWNIQAVIYAFWEPLVAWGLFWPCCRVLRGAGRVWAPSGACWRGGPTRCSSSIRRSWWRFRWRGAMSPRRIW